MIVLLFILELVAVYLAAWNLLWIGCLIGERISEWRTKRIIKRQEDAEIEQALMDAHFIDKITSKK